MSEVDAAADTGFDEAFESVWSEAAAPEGADTGAVTTEEPAGEEPQPETTDETATPDGRARDEKGRFVSTTPDQEQAESPEPVTDEEPAQPTDTAPEPEQEPQAPSIDPAVQAQFDALPPVTYRAYGQDFAIPGSKLGPEGAFIPKTALQEIARFMGSGREYHRRAGEWEQRVKDADARAEAAEVSRDTVLQRLDQLVAEGGLEDFLLDVARNYPVLKAEAEAAGLRRMNEQLRNGQQTREQQEQEAALRPVMDRALAEKVREFGQSAGLGKDDLKALYARLRAPEYQSVIFPVADRDMPEIGTKKGQRVINYAAIQQEVDLLASVVQRYKQPPVVEQAAQRNAERQASRPKPTPPPTVAARRGPAPTGKQGKPPTFASTKEADEYWFGAGLDEHVG